MVEPFLTNYGPQLLCSSLKKAEKELDLRAHPMLQDPSKFNKNQPTKIFNKDQTRLRLVADEG